MTQINNTEDLKELLIKNLPSQIKGGNDKETANIIKLNSNIALESFKFINFNSKEQISILVFDMDKYGDATALEL